MSDQASVCVHLNYAVLILKIFFIEVKLLVFNLVTNSFLAGFFLVGGGQTRFIFRLIADAHEISYFSSSLFPVHFSFTERIMANTIP